MEYVGQIVNGIIALIFAVISWRVKRYLDSITEREAELQSALASKEAELHAMLAEDRKHMEEIRIANNRGTQALLRDRLLQGYHFFRKRGMVTYGEARNYENINKSISNSIYKHPFANQVDACIFFLKSCKVNDVFVILRNESKLTGNELTKPYLCHPFPHGTGGMRGEWIHPCG